jgi:hypothetical protein
LEFLLKIAIALIALRDRVFEVKSRGARRFRCGVAEARPFVCRCLNSVGPGRGRGLAIEQRTYRQQVDSTKTTDSSAELHVDASVLQLLKDWRQISQFRGEEDWMFASPIKLGRLPISYPWFWRSFNDAAIKAGVGPLGTHTLRHPYRSWIDSVGTAVAVQQS